MGAFAGFVDTETRAQAEPSLVDLLSTAAGQRETDGPTLHIDNHLAFVHHAFHTTLESHKERQPFVQGPVVVVLDGRIDNRGELSRKLGMDAQTLPDVNLVAAAYLRWGNACFSEILGDFAIAVWDKLSESLTLARDPFGVRGLFFSHHRSHFYFATDISTLLAIPSLNHRVNENHVAMSLAYLPEGDSTAFANINPVEPGTYVVIAGRRQHKQRFWGFENISESKIPQSELKDCCFSLIEKAVSVCLRSDRTITAELSGGLDSSTIVCIADALLKAGKGPSVDLQTTSFVYNAAQSSDERNFITLVQRQVQRRNVHHLVDERPVFSEWPDPEFLEYPNRLHCFGGALQQQLDSMRSRNSRVLLSGAFGDQLFVSQQSLPYHAADLLNDGHVRRAYDSCRSWSFERREPVLPTIWHAAVRPQLPDWTLRAIAKHSNITSAGPKSYRIPSWINPELMKRTELRERVRLSAYGDPKWRGGSRRVRYTNLMQCVGWFGSGYRENAHTSSKIEMRYPYTYRPLVEFLLSVPFEQMCNEKFTRILHRQAIEGWVPEPVRRRVSKKGPMEAILIGFRAEWPRLKLLIHSSRAVERGYVLRKQLEDEARRWLHGQVQSDLLRFFALEMWLRALENSAVARKATGSYSSR